MMKFYAILIVCLFAVSANAALVAYFPVDSATDTSKFLDDIIDDASHGAADGTTNSTAGGIVYDAIRGGDVAFSPQGHRYTAGTQDIDLAEGFTWSLWWKSSGVNVNINEGGADVIIGSRSGSWNKVQVTGTARFFELGNYNLDDAEWHHIVYTGVSTGVDTEYAAMWIDGVKVSEDTNGSFDNLQVENTKLEIGGASQFGEDSDGYLDDVAIWNEVISDEWIGLLYGGANPQTIPEPASLALLGLGGLVMLRRGKKT
jgi:hypothetical protein